ncbi:MAG: hypothetical protein H7334_07105 [Ferruginibacter sp.]|nr:hypothetical protein [Ferruginibacter sp.]
MGNIVGYALKGRSFSASFRFYPFFVKTKKLNAFTGIELFVSRSRLELPSAAADIKPMLNELRF